MVIFEQNLFSAFRIVRDWRIKKITGNCKIVRQELIKDDFLKQKDQILSRPLEKPSLD